MSINQLDNTGAKVTFHNGTVNITYPNGKVAQGLKVNGMYKVNSESNGVVERAFQTVSNLARTLMLQGGFKKSAWPELFRTAAYLENRLPNMANPDQKSPIELLKGSPPDLSNLHVIGSP
eukprot:gene28030-36935_t